MDFWTLVTSYVCSVTSLVSNQNGCQVHSSAAPAPQEISDNQVHIVPIIRETDSFLPMAVQIMCNVVDQAMHTEMKKIVYESFITKELSSARPTEPEEESTADTESLTTVATPVKSVKTTTAGSSQVKSFSTSVEPDGSATTGPPASSSTSIEPEGSATAGPPQAGSSPTSIEPESSATTGPPQAASTSVEPENSATTKRPQARSFSTPVETDETAAAEIFELLRAKYESQLKETIVSELFDSEGEPIREGMLFKSDTGGGVVSNEQDSLPGSKQDPKYWEPDVEKLLDSNKVAEIFRQISPELLWVGQLRDHLISEAIHRRLRNTSGLSSTVLQFLYQIDHVNARDQTLLILQKILETKDISEQKTVELAHRVISLLSSPDSTLSQTIARCQSIRYT